MSQPVKLSDSLVLDARVASEVVQRSIAGQVEFWARLGKSVERILEGDQVLQLCRAGAAQPLSACLGSVDSPAGRSRVAAYLEQQPFPHYQPHPAFPGLLERIEQDGTRTTGRFVNRQFESVAVAALNPFRPKVRIAECKPCGYVWKARGPSLSRCPRCSGKDGVSFLDANQVITARKSRATNPDKTRTAARSSAR